MMKKQKPLLPSLKQKKRYVVYKAISKHDLKQDRIYASIKGSFEDLFGTYGLADAGLMPVNAYDPINKMGMVKIRNTSLDRLRVSFAFIDAIDKKDAIIRCMGVSGILKKAKNKYMSEVKKCNQCRIK